MLSVLYLVSKLICLLRKMQNSLDLNKKFTPNRKFLIVVPRMEDVMEVNLSLYMTTSTRMEFILIRIILTRLSKVNVMLSLTLIVRDLI